MEILMYPKELLDLSAKAFPTVAQDKRISHIIDMLYTHGDKNVRMKYAFRQEKPVVIRKSTYRRARLLVEELCRKAGIPQGKKFFKHIKSVKESGIDILSVKQYYHDICTENTMEEIKEGSIELAFEKNKFEKSKLERLLVLAADALWFSQSKDKYIDMANEFINDAIRMIGGANNDARS